MTLTKSAETVMNVSKVALAIDHIKNNRIEYLIVLLLSHMIGLTEKVYTKTAGVCS